MQEKSILKEEDLTPSMVHKRSLEIVMEKGKSSQGAVGTVGDAFEVGREVWSLCGE